jgi:2-methylcitrate dehydratase PrpD
MVEKIACAEEKSTGDEPQSNSLREVSELKKKIFRKSAIPGSITCQSPRTDSSDDPAWEIVRFVLSTKYMNIPPDVLDYAKRLILDTIGLLIGGSATETIPELVELVKGWGGKEESPILVYGGKVPAPNAAFVLGPMTRAFDMGDTHPEAGHLCEHIIPALLATLGLRGSVTGKEFISAFVVAAEVGARVGDASFSCSGGFDNPTDSDLWAWRLPNSADYGSVLGVAKLLNLDDKTTHTALGIQHWAVGAHGFDLAGNLMMRYQHAFLCQSAVYSVLLAQRGVTGPAHIFGGPTGYFASFFPWKNEINLLTKDIGRSWSFATTYIKGYTGCFITHGPVTAMEELRKEYSINPRDIETMEVTQSYIGYALARRKEEYWNPKTFPEAQFSMPYALATMAIYGNVFVDDFTPEALARADTRELMTKIKVKWDKKLPNHAAIVKVSLKDGTEYVKRVDFPKGHPIYRPMNWDDVIRKFKGCLAPSAKPIPDANAEQVIQMIRNLEECGDVTKIVELLIP